MLAELLEAIFESVGFVVDGQACEAEVWEQAGSLGLTDECSLEVLLWNKGKKHKVEYLLQVKNKLVDPEVERWEKTIDLLAVSIDQKVVWDRKEDPMDLLESLEEFEEKEEKRMIKRGYYYYSPRGFGNEYTIFVVAVGSEGEGRLLNWFGEQDNDVNTVWRKLNKEEAIYYCRKYHKEAKAWGEEVYGGLVCPWDPTTSDNDNFDAAIAATQEFLAEQEEGFYE